MEPRIHVAVLKPEPATVFEEKEAENLLRQLLRKCIRTGLLQAMAMAEEIQLQVSS